MAVTSDIAESIIWHYLGSGTVDHVIKRAEDTSESSTWKQLLWTFQHINLKSAERGSSSPWGSAFSSNSVYARARQMRGKYDQRKTVFRAKVKDTIKPTGTCATVISLVTISSWQFEPGTSKRCCHLSDKSWLLLMLLIDQSYYWWETDEVEQI